MRIRWRPGVGLVTSYGEVRCDQDGVSNDISPNAVDVLKSAFPDEVEILDDENSTPPTSDESPTPEEPKQQVVDVEPQQKPEAEPAVAASESKAAPIEESKAQEAAEAESQVTDPESQGEAASAEEAVVPEPEEPKQEEPAAKPQEPAKAVDPAIQGLSVKELRKMATEKGIDGTERMDRAALLTAISG